MNNAADATITLYPSYAELIGTLLSEFVGMCVLDSNLDSLSRSGLIDPREMRRWVRERGGVDSVNAPMMKSRSANDWVVALPLRAEDASFTAILFLRLAGETEPEPLEIGNRIQPALTLLYRELINNLLKPDRPPFGAERAKELLWISNVSGSLHEATGQQHSLERLINDARESLGCEMAYLAIPGKRVTIESSRDPHDLGAVAHARESTQKHLLTWAQRRRQPLMLNSGRCVPDTEWATCRILSVPVAADGNDFAGVIAFLNPVNTELFTAHHLMIAEQISQQVQYLLSAKFDLTTGLYSRAAFKQAYAASNVIGTTSTQALLCFDVDRLHDFNDSYGAEAGDDLLRSIAEVMHTVLPPDALLGRISGDRFAAVLANVNAKAAVPLAESVNQAVSALRLGSPERSARASVSCGISDLVSVPEGLMRALAAAEVACRAAKDLGRNRVEIYRCESTNIMRRHDDILAAGLLREALKFDHLLLYAQPIVPLQGASPQANCEILLRLKLPDGSIDSIGPYISVAHQHQLLPILDRWVVENALRQLAPFADLLLQQSFGVSLNISAPSIVNRHFVDDLMKQIAAHHIAPATVSIEITEQSAMTNLTEAANGIRRLREFGCRVALDDFGTGSNSLLHLQNLPFSGLKIAGSFVSNILLDPRSEASVRGILQLAKDFGLETVGQYVESDAIADKLRQLGVDYAQGYAFGRPRPLADVLSEMRLAESMRLRTLAI